MVALLADSGSHVGFVRRLPAVALVAVVAGATGSLALMLYVGRRNPSRILLLLFTVWVLSPFVGLALAAGRARRWSVATRESVHLVTLIVAVGSLAIYGAVAFGPPRRTPAFAFLVVPLVSWVLIAATVAIAAVRAGRPADRGGSA